MVQVQWQIEIENGQMLTLFDERTRIFLQKNKKNIKADTGYNHIQTVGRLRQSDRRMDFDKQVGCLATEISWQ